MTTVNPQISSGYYLTTGNNPITFGPSTRINVPTDNYFGVWSSEASVYWDVTNAGRIDAERGNYATGVVLPNGIFTNLDGGYVYGFGKGVSLLGGTVANDQGGTIACSYFAGVIAYNDAGTVTNAGSIASKGDKAVFLNAGGVVDNQVGGSISGLDRGIYIKGGIGMVTNAGSIGGGANGAVSLEDGGSVDNTGMINGIVNIIGTAGTVSNELGGVIESSSAGIVVVAGGVVTNGGTISAQTGIAILTNTAALAATTITNRPGGMVTGTTDGIFITNNAATVVNDGTIVGGVDAVKLVAGYANRLIDEPGAVFTGSVDGGNTLGAAAVTTLELASGSAPGILSGLGAQFVNFGAIAFDAGASWFVAGSPAGLAGAISGFAPGDTIELTGMTATGSSFSSGILTLTETSGSATLDVGAGFALGNFVITESAGNTEVTVACFAEGTRIATPDGAVAVERLRPGHLVRSAFGGSVPVVWTGYRRIRTAWHANPAAVWPIRLCAGALAENVPARDLLLSPEHAVHLDGLLIPVGLLVNGDTILQERRAEITYWHVELPQHDVLLAEGAACESYLDTGNRADFDGGAVIAAHPALGADANEIWLANACAPQCRDGERLDTIKVRLAARAIDISRSMVAPEPGSVRR